MEKLIKEYNDKLQKANTYKDSNYLFKKYYKEFTSKSNKHPYEIQDGFRNRQREILLKLFKDNGFYDGIKLKNIETGKTGILTILQCYCDLYPVIKWIKKDGTTSRYNYKRISKSYNEERIIYALNNYYTKMEVE